MTDYPVEVSRAIEALGGVQLPDTVGLLGVAGEGSRAVVFRASHRGETVALKVYRPEAVATYRERHGCNIAVYEMSRNRAFRKVQELTPFSARPILVLGHDGQQSVSFMQEFIDGETLADFGRSHGGIPASVLEAGEIIAREAKRAGLEGFSLDYRDVMVRQQAGRWLPVIQDFNQPPAGETGGKGLMGLFRKGPRPAADPIREWGEYARKCSG